MNLHRKITFAAIAALAILCAIQIAYDPLNITSNIINNESVTEVREPTTEIQTVIKTIKEDKTVDIQKTEAITESTSAKREKEIKVSNTTPTTTGNTQLSNTSYTEDDLFYLASAVCREAGGSSEEIQLLVANVIINRVNSSRYPDTIYGVLTQRMQYGTMWKYGISFPKWANQAIKDQCYSVARRILEGERVCPENVLYQAEFKQGSGVYKQFDGFYFCYC